MGKLNVHHQFAFFSCADTIATSASRKGKSDDDIRKEGEEANEEGDCGDSNIEGDGNNIFDANLWRGCSNVWIICQLKEIQGRT